MGNRDIVLELFGPDTVLVPCEAGTKKPIVTWKHRALESTRSDAYIALFEQEVNVAVRLGAVSNHLIALDFDADPDLELFLELNPHLEQTTRSFGARGAQLWVRIPDGQYPQSCKTEHFEFRANDRLSTILGRHPTGTDYELLVAKPPVELAFEDIAWPETWRKPWEEASLKALQTRFGEPYYTNKQNAVTTINERFFAGLYTAENICIWEPNEESFYEYNAEDGAFHLKPPEAIQAEIADRILETGRQVKQFDLERKITATNLRNITHHIRGIALKEEAFTRRSAFIHAANGILCLEKGDIEFREFSPDIVSRNPGAIPFDPKATCPRFLNELVLPAVGDDNAVLLQKLAGQFLLGRNITQRILILDGNAGTGKTQFSLAIQGLVGHHNVMQLRTDILGERFETDRFVGRTLLVGVDVDADFMRHRGANSLKGLVGGDWYYTERKGSARGTRIQGDFNVMIGSNARLKVRLKGDIGAWRRRIIIVRYECKPPKVKIPNFGPYLLDLEGPGMLNWAIHGALMLLQDVENNNGEVRMTPAQGAVVDSLLAESDSLRWFLEDCVVKAPDDPSADLTVQEINEAYADYCPSRGWTVMPINEVQRQIEQLMLELYGVSKRNDIRRDGKSQRGFSRVSWKGDQAQEGLSL